jgi:S-DNA-T family DNA segregation ATPase FtsK/SpoIIIE
MLFLSPNSSKPMRIQGPYIDDKEINNLVDFLKKNTQVIHYTEEVTEQKVKTMMDTSGNVSIQSDNRDPLFEQAIQIVCEAKKASASLLQRRCSIGYSRAARVLDELQEAGIVGPPDGSKPREVLIHDPSEVME